MPDDEDDPLKRALDESSGSMPDLDAPGRDARQRERSELVEQIRRRRRAVDADSAELVREARPPDRG